jgi:hypothetical protein
MGLSTKAEHYEVRVRGVLSERLLGAFPDLQASTQRGDTVLAGWLPDQAALHGVLAQIEALGLELLSVRRPSEERGRIEPEPPTSAVGDGL